MWAFIVRSGYENSFYCHARFGGPLLTKVNREDCVDFLASNMKAEVKNRFGKVSELKRLTMIICFCKPPEVALWK